MRTLVTGATGLIGNAVAKQLIAAGHAVRCIVRDVARARRCLPEAAELVTGDIEQPASLADAVRGIDWVFHAAGMPEQWQPDETMFERVNTRGTRNVVEAALGAGVRRVV